MPGLAPDECWRLVGPVDIGPVLPGLAALEWFRSGQSSAAIYAADVVVQGGFSPELDAFLPVLQLGGKTARAILRRLGPRQSIPPHVDDWMPKEKTWRRFQVPLVSDPSVVMRWPDDGQELWLEPGFVYEVRFDRTHEVVNGWDGSRIHLQVDQTGAEI